jgi:hypothetical protein
MSDSQILKELFKDVVIQTLDERAEGTHKVYSVTLNENKGGYCITIDKMSNHDEVIIINPEVFKAPLAVFNGSKGECNVNVQTSLLLILKKK